MNLWREIETVTSNLDVIDVNTRRLIKLTPKQKLGNIRKNMFAEGITYTDACYVQRIANMVKVKQNIVRADYLNGLNMTHVLSFSRLLDTVIDEVNKLKQ